MCIFDITALESVQHTWTTVRHFDSQPCRIQFKVSKIGFYSYQWQYSWLFIYLKWTLTRAIFPGRFLGFRYSNLFIYRLMFWDIHRTSTERYCLFTRTQIANEMSAKYQSVSQVARLLVSAQLCRCPTWLLWIPVCTCWVRYTCQARMLWLIELNFAW